MSRESIDLQNANLLWGRAGGMCSFRDRFKRCQRPLTKDPTPKDPAVITGIMCHIIPVKEPHQRKIEEEIDLNKLNSYENLILLCSDHHQEIDKLPERYTVKKLRKMKEWHEYWVKKFQKKDVNPVILRHKIMYNSFLYTLSIYIIAGFLVLIQGSFVGNHPYSIFLCLLFHFSILSLSCLFI